MLNLKSNGERLKTNRITFVLFFLVAFKISDLKTHKAYDERLFDCNTYVIEPT